MTAFASPEEHETSSLDRCFPLDACLCEALIPFFSRSKADEGRLKPSDVWTLLGLWSLADCRSRDARTLGRHKGVRTVMFDFRLVELLDEIGFQRPRTRRVGYKPDFSGDTWSAVRTSLDRLAKTVVTIRYTARTKALRGRRATTENRTFTGSLIAVDAPTIGAGIISVTLHIYDGIETNYFVLMRRRLFVHRRELKDSSARLIIWLVKQHRGRTFGGRIRHRWKIPLRLDELSAKGVITKRHGRPKEAHENLGRAIAHLVGLGVICRAEECVDHFELELSPDFFHREDEGE